MNSFLLNKSMRIEPLKELFQAPIKTVVAAAKTICQRIISLANSVFAAIYHYWYRKNIAAKNTMSELLGLLKNYQPHVTKESLKDPMQERITCLERLTRLPDNAPEILEKFEVLKTDTTLLLTIAAKNIMSELLGLLKNYQPHVTNEYSKNNTQCYITCFERLTRLPDNSPKILKNFEVLKNNASSNLIEAINGLIDNILVEIFFTKLFLPEDSLISHNLQNLYNNTQLQRLKLKRQKQTSPSNLHKLRLDLEASYCTIINQNGDNFAREFLSPLLKDHKEWAAKMSFSASEVALTFNFSPHASNRDIFKEYRRYLRSLHLKLKDIKKEFIKLLSQTTEGPDQTALECFEEPLRIFDPWEKNPHAFMKDLYTLSLKFKQIKDNLSSECMLG